MAERDGILWHRPGLCPYPWTNTSSRGVWCPHYPGLGRMSPLKSGVELAHLTTWADRRKVSHQKEGGLDLGKQIYRCPQYQCWKYYQGSYRRSYRRGPTSSTHRWGNWGAEMLSLARYPEPTSRGFWPLSCQRPHTNPPHLLSWLSGKSAAMKNIFYCFVFYQNSCRYML